MGLMFTRCEFYKDLTKNASLNYSKISRGERGHSGLGLVRTNKLEYEYLLHSTLQFLYEMCIIANRIMGGKGKIMGGKSKNSTSIDGMQGTAYRFEKN